MGVVMLRYRVVGAAPTKLLGDLDHKTEGLREKGLVSADVFVEADDPDVAVVMTRWEGEDMERATELTKRAVGEHEPAAEPVVLVAADRSDDD